MWAAEATEKKYTVRSVNNSDTHSGTTYATLQWKFLEPITDGKLSTSHTYASVKSLNNTMRRTGWDVLAAQMWGSVADYSEPRLKNEMCLTNLHSLTVQLTSSANRLSIYRQDRAQFDAELHAIFFLECSRMIVSILDASR